MNSYFMISIQDVELGKNGCWLKFHAYVGRYDVNKKYEIDYCGTGISSDIPLTDEQKEMFRSQLNKDFGYAPFDIVKAKRILGDGRQYRIAKHAANTL